MKITQSTVPQPTAEPNRFKMDFPSLPGRIVGDIDVFNSGLTLVVMHSALHQPVQIQKMVSEPIIGLGFCLAGEFDVSFMPSKPRLNIRAGQTGLFTFHQDVEITEHLPADHMLRIYLMLEGELLSSFTQGDEDY